MKKPPKIKHAYIDADLALFPAASISPAQSMEYYFVDPDGNEVGTFDSAKSAQNWLDECEIMGVDIIFGYKGDFSKLERQDRIHLGKLSDAIENYQKIIEKWVKATGATSYTCYVSKKSGLENFRHKVSLRKPYKGNRKDSVKPYYLEQLRNYVLTLPNHKVATGNVECDDVCVGMASRKPSNVLIQNEKDGLQTVGCWVYHPDVMTKPVFSRPDTVGWVKKEGNKLLGLGHLFLLGQILTGDGADNYSGLDGCGAVKAFELLSPFNKLPIDHLSEAVGVVCQAYYDKYGLEYSYKNKDGESAVGNWKDFLYESLQLAYMRKNRNDVVPQPYVDMIEEWERLNVK